jgi:hypothetical protein
MLTIAINRGSRAFTTVIIGYAAFTDGITDANIYGAVLGAFAASIILEWISTNT